MTLSKHWPSWKFPHWLQLQPFYEVQSPILQWVVMLATALVYIGLGKFTFSFLDLDGPAPFPVFPPIGVGLALVILLGTPAWLGTFLGAAAFAIILKAPGLVIFGAGLRSAVATFLVGYLTRVLRVDIRLQKLRDVLLLVMVIFPVPIALNAMLACFIDIGVYTGWQDLPKTWRTLFIADLVSVLMITPFLMVMVPALQHLEPSRFRQRVWQWWHRSNAVLEGVAWLTFTLLVSLGRHEAGTDLLLLESLPFLSLAWSAARFGMIPTVCASFWINSMEIVHVLRGHGLFVLNSENDLNAALLMLQTFIGVVVVMGLCLAALTEERQDLLKSVTLEQKFDRVLLDIAHRVGESLDVQEIMNIALEGIYNSLDVDRVYLSELRPDGSSVVTAELCRAECTPCFGYTLPPDFVREMAEWYEGKGLEVMDDIRRPEGLHPLVVRLCHQFQVQARVAVPVLVDGRGYGILAVHQCTNPRHWTSHETCFLEQVAVPLGTAVHQSLLYQRERNLVQELDQKVQDRTEALQRSLVAQEQLNEGQTRLLHAVSHDLRTPIVGSLLVLGQMLKRDEGRDAKVLSRLKESGERQLLMIQSLLEDYRAEDATLRFRFKALDYSEFVQATQLTLAPILREYQASVTTDLAPHLPEIQADPLHLQRVLENLVTNALKHNQPGLNLKINASLLTEDSIARIRCELMDDGVGIPTEVAHQLFSRPYLRSSDGSKRDGLGLGLYLCNQIINAHGGQLYVEPAEQGAKFVFTLPTAVYPVEPSVLPEQLNN